MAQVSPKQHSIAAFRHGGVALTALERAELQRQGAKAAARGDPADANPMRQRLEASDDGTGERHLIWAQRAAAWQAGYESQVKARKKSPPNPGSEPDRDVE
jgi:hypothetical protein